MIDELHVSDLALVREARLAPAAGLTALTGETGAGKTALLAALRLLAGERGDASLVREGARRLVVEGRFFDPSSASVGEKARPPEGELFAPIGKMELFGQDGCVASRELGRDGRSRVRMDGSLAAVSQLAEKVGASIDLCGQHEHVSLLKPANHRAMLDSWAASSIAPAKEAYAKAWEASVQAAQELAAVRAAGELGEAQVAQARFVLERIDAVGPAEGEYDELRAKLARIENAAELMEAYQGAHEALVGDSGALDALAAAASWLDQAAAVDAPLREKAQALREASFVVEDIARDVGSARANMDFDTGDLERLSERMSALQGLMRSWGPTMREVFAAHEDAARTLASVDSYDEQLSLALAAQTKAEEALEQAAAQLHAQRARVAPEFAAAVCAQMAKLDLGSASLECAVSLQERGLWAAHGPDAVEFLFKPASAMSARPLARIASGGEISRVMLAVKVVLGAADDAQTLVFDEVDAGVGGSAARALAQLLVELAQTHQVIVVTHLPQVAVVADVHYVVRKTEGELPETQLALLSGSERVKEVARMLSGDTGEASLAHAEEMLAQAQKHA